MRNAKMNRRNGTIPSQAHSTRRETLRRAGAGVTSAVSMGDAERPFRTLLKKSDVKRHRLASGTISRMAA
jgi:hypothetical protein